MHGTVKNKNLGSVEVRFFKEPDGPYREDIVFHRRDVRCKIAYSSDERDMFTDEILLFMEDPQQFVEDKWNLINQEGSHHEKLL